MRKIAALRLVAGEAPTTLFGSTPHKRAPRKHHKFMTEAEIEALAKAAGSHRDRTMILVAFRHGLRANEVVNLRWDQIDLGKALLTIYRSKHGRDATHPMPGGEIRDLRRLHRETERASEFVFVSRLGSPMTMRAFGQMTKRTAAAAGLANVHPHALRHACGYKLALEGRSMRDIQHYLGHRRIASTEIYTEHAPTNFRGWFK
jgi:type 1 fimbriae regulatory protein FimB/type 1 fimbriae regulatory protein FimE